jgi:hypothetical protein
MNRIIFIAALLATGFANASISFQDFVGSYEVVSCKQYEGEFHTVPASDCVSTNSKIGIENATSEGIQISFQGVQGVSNVVSLFEGSVDKNNVIEETLFVEGKNRAEWIRVLKSPITVERKVVESFTISYLSAGHPILVHYYIGANSLHVRQVYRLDTTHQY